MADIITIMISLSSAILVAAIGHLLSLKKIKKKSFFLKKFEYFEKISERLEQEGKDYHKLLRKINEAKTRKRLHEHLKELQEMREIHESKFNFNQLNIFQNKTIALNFVEYFELQRDFYSNLKKLSKDGKGRELIQETDKKLIGKKFDIIDELKKELKL